MDKSWITDSRLYVVEPPLDLAQVHKVGPRYLKNDFILLILGGWFIAMAARYKIVFLLLVNKNTFSQYQELTWEILQSICINLKRK